MAKTRDNNVDEIRKQIAAHAGGRMFGLPGEPGVEVRRWNLILDEAK